MPEPVAVDVAAVSAVVQRVTRAADELPVIPVSVGPALPGSALTGLNGPPRAADDVRRLGTAVHDWVRLAGRSVDALIAADDGTAQRLRPR